MLRIHGSRQLLMNLRSASRLMSGTSNAAKEVYKNVIHDADNQRFVIHLEKGE